MQYLKRRPARPDGSWYLNHPIPKDLQKAYLTANGKPQTHIVKALGTRDPDVAYRLKVELMPAILREFAQKDRELRGTQPADLVQAFDLRRSIREADNADNYELASTLADVATSTAERIHIEGGSSAKSLARAQSFVRISSGEETLQEAFEDWLERGTLPVRTKAKYRTALQEFVGFLGGHPLIRDMTRANAIRYVDWLNSSGRSQRTKRAVPLSFNSKRDRVMALSAFWNKGLSARNKTDLQVNPWSKLEVTTTPTGSDVKWDSMANAGRPSRRPYFDEADLLAILDAPGPRESGATKYGKRTLMEVLALALYTGARSDEVCSLRLSDIRPAQGGYVLNLVDTKNKDSDRRIPVVHPIAVAALKRRIADRTQGDELLFSEFRPKKGNDSLYELVGRALARHLQRATNLQPGAVPYCTRHTLQTRMGNREDVKDAVMQRYVGHRPAGMTDQHYRNITPDALLSFAQKVDYWAPVEARLRDELGL